ncbi:MAG: LysM repeat protein [Acidimicrobiales bacterium]
MRQIRVTSFFLVVALTLSSCGLFGGSDSTDVAVAEDVAAQPTVNNVQSVPAQTPGSTTDGGAAALPTAVTLPTTAPMPEPTVDRSQPTTYIVQSGDVLGLIAERFDADIAELRLINNLDGNLIRVGQALTIPALDGLAAASDDEGSTDTAGASSAAASAASSGPVSCNSTASGHCVQPGESLLGIALEYDVTVESLRAANPGVSGDLIKSGEVLNLPGEASNPAPGATVAPTSPSTPSGTPVPADTVGPLNDADCTAVNPLFPFYHAADGLCYANPIGGTAVPTAVGASDVTCEAGRFLWEDGLCYPIPGVTVTPTVGATATPSPLPNYGTIPCRAGYLPLESGRCWPEPATTPSTVTPVGAATSTSGNTVTCVEPNFTSSAGGTCFLLQAGVDAGCTLEAGVAKCPSS